MLSHIAITSKKKKKNSYHGADSVISNLLMPFIRVQVTVIKTNVRFGHRALSLNCFAALSLLMLTQGISWH